MMDPTDFADLEPIHYKQINVEFPEDINRINTSILYQLWIECRAKLALHKAGILIFCCCDCKVCAKAMQRYLICLKAFKLL